MLKNMKTQTHLKPGQKGTKRLVEEYGQSLVCVRYRYDKVRRVRLKTIEIIVEEKAWPLAPSTEKGSSLLCVWHTRKKLSVPN